MSGGAAAATTTTALTDSGGQLSASSSQQIAPIRVRPHPCHWRRGLLANPHGTLIAYDATRQVCEVLWDDASPRDPPMELYLKPGRYEVLIEIGPQCRVMRNNYYWPWKNQDGQSMGTVLSVENDVAFVAWDNGTQNKYRWGRDNAYDLEVAATLDSLLFASSLESTARSSATPATVTAAVTAAVTPMTSPALPLLEENSVDDSGRLASKRLAKPPPFSLKKKIGEGKFGVVVESEYDGEKVAIKRLRDASASSTVAEATRELGVTCSVSHPNIVRLIGWWVEGGEDDEVRLYLVFPLMPPPRMVGGALKEACDKQGLGPIRILPADAPRPCRGPGGPLGWRMYFRISIGVAQALAYLAERKFVHRDIKPANILLTAEGTPLLADFGTAKRLEPDITATRGQGTPAYMAPEIFLGSHTITPAVDVYSFGCVMWQLLTGETPRANCQNDIEVMKVVESGAKIPEVLNIPPRLNALIESMTHKDPKMRPPAAMIVHELNELAKELVTD